MAAATSRSATTRDQHVDVHAALGDRLHPDLPAVLGEPAGELPGRLLLGAGLARADHRAAGSRIITSPPSRAPAVIMPRIGISASW